MERKVASRKLKRTCICCNKPFVKGDVYYRKRVVLNEKSELVSYEYLVCAKCKYVNERHSERYKKFVESEKCHHPVTTEIWTTIVGEDYVKEPSHTECCICGKCV